MTTDGVSRDDLIAAVREAGGTETVDVAAEEQAAQAPAAEAPAAEAAAAQPEESKLDRILREREKAHQEREAARSGADDMIARARQESERIIREAQERANQEWQAEMQRRRQAFDADPTNAIRALGDPQSVVDRVLQQNTPEARAQAAIQQQLEDLRKQTTEASAAKQEIETLRQQVANYAREQEVARVRAVFTGQHATPEKAPYAYAELGGADNVFDAANRQAIEWQQKGLKLGVDFDFDDVASYVEREAKSRFESKLKALNLTPAQQSGAGTPATGSGLAPKSAANGTRPLTAAQGSERRTSPKPLSEMSTEDARKALMEEVAAARKANPDAVM